MATNSSSKALRSLMKERQLSKSKRIQHQFAKYDSIGRLNCSICPGTTVKSESLWAAHLTSKSHRLNFQKISTQSTITAKSLSTNNSKRKTGIEEEESDRTDLIKPDNENLTEANGNGNEGHRDKKVRFNQPSSSSSSSSSPVQPETNQKSSNVALPADFFDDDSLRKSYEDQLNKSSEKEELQEEEEEDPDELEWRAFKEQLESTENHNEDNNNNNNPENIFHKASSYAEPVYYSNNTNNAKGGENDDEKMDEDKNEEKEKEPEEEEEDPIEKKIREEKEEIMDRIQNEEREQFEADQRVQRIKSRIESFKLLRKSKKNNS